MFAVYNVTAGHYTYRNLFPTRAEAEKFARRALRGGVPGDVHEVRDLSEAEEARFRAIMTSAL